MLPIDVRMSVRSCRRPQKPLSAVLCLLFTLFLSVFSVGAKAASDTPTVHDAKWAELARQGHGAFVKKDYQSAITSYKLALQHLKPLDTGDETSIDVGLCLAESCICVQDLALAQQYLDAITAGISRRERWIDPLLPARYYRRLSKLRQAQGRKAASAAAYARSVVVMRKCFEQNADRMKAVNRPLSELLMSAQSDPTEQSVKDLEELLGALSQWARSSGLSESDLNSARSICKKIYESRLKTGDFELTERAISTMGTLHTPGPDIARMWTRWWGNVAMRKQMPPRAVLQKAAATIDDRFKSSRSHDLVMIRGLLLGTLEHAQGNHNQAHKLLESTLHGTSESVLAFETRVIVCRYFLEQACILLDLGNPNDLAEQFLLEVRELTPLSEQSDQDLANGLSHARIDLILTRLYIYQNRFDKAATAIDTIPKDALISGSDPFLSTYVRFNSRIAKNQIQSGQDAIGRKRLKRAWPIIRRVKNTSERAALNQFVNRIYDECQSTSKDDAEVSR